MQKPSFLPQPPPGAPPPSAPDSQAQRSRSRMAGLVIFGSVAVAIVLLDAPWFYRYGSMGTPAPPSKELLEAERQLEAISEGLRGFERTYDKRPDEWTAMKVKKATRTPLTLGHSSSNQLFRQLLVTGMAEESAFYADLPGMRRGDGDFKNDATALEKGECAFAYIPGLGAASAPETPEVVAPLVPGTTVFDPKPFHGMAVVLRLDGVVTRLPLDATGHALDGGKDLFDPSQPYWRGKAPVIRWQE